MPMAPSAMPVGTSGRGPVRARSRALAKPADKEMAMTSGRKANPVRKGEKLNAPISVGNVAVTMLQISNIAWRVNRELQLDARNGQIQNDSAAMKMWGREYEKGWEPRL